MTFVRVKVCGITSVEDALSTVWLGANAIGFVFWPNSSRYITPADAREIIIKLPPFIVTVGVYVDPTAEWVEETARIAGLSLLQFHGNEPYSFCDQFSLPYIKAIRVRKGVDLIEYAKSYHRAQGLLLDAYTPGLPGGTGHIFDWKLIPRGLSLPLILSGGLNPKNVTLAIKQTKPWGVDVSSGVEMAKGVKDKEKISAFMQGVRNSESL